MSYGFRIMVEGDYACFTRPELKVERVSYDVPTPGAMEGLLKSIYWNKVLLSAVKNQMKGKGADPCIYTSESRSQRAAMVLKNVKYGIEFHFEMTGERSDNEDEDEKKHFNIIKRRLEKGQCFRTPCLGCSEFPAKRIELVDEFDESLISEAVIRMGDVDLGFMSYRVEFEDGGKPVNGDWENPKFSDKASTIYYRPHMVKGVIDVRKYREELRC